jgi:hypothetical protein
VGGNLYKNRIMYASVGATQDISCDSNNRIWLAHLQDTISILNPSTNTFIFSERIGRESQLPLNPCSEIENFRTINFLKVPISASCNNNAIYQDQTIIVDNKDNIVYLIDPNGNFISKLDLQGLVSLGNSLSFQANGDFTSFQYLRKFAGINSKNLSWNLKLADPEGNNSLIVSLSSNVGTLPQGWHHFTLTFDAFNGVVTSYIDSIQVNQYTFTPSKYILYYDYRSSLLLGAASVLNNSLNDIIGVQNSYKFIGKVSELKMYSTCLTQGEVEQVYFSSSFAQPRTDLNWNMEVGNRNYIEEIEHWFKFQLPGSKSKYFNINIHNLNIEDMDIKNIIEDTIRQNIAKIAPAESSLYNINWM